MEHIQLGIIEDDRVIRESLVAFLGANPAVTLVVAVDSVEAFLETRAAPDVAPVDILLLDIGLPGISGLEGIRPIRKVLPKVDIVMLTTYEEEATIFQALCAGAVSYLSKRTPLPQIREAVFTIARGGAYMSPAIARKVVSYFAAPQPSTKNKLTKRQMQITQAVVDGLSYKMIAEKHLISIDNVRYHLKKIYRKLDINSKSELVKKALSGEL